MSVPYDPSPVEYATHITEVAAWLSSGDVSGHYSPVEALELYLEVLAMREVGTDYTPLEYLHGNARIYAPLVDAGLLAEAKDPETGAVLSYIIMWLVPLEDRQPVS